MVASARDRSGRVRECLAPLRLTLRGEVSAAVPLEPGESVLVDWRIQHGGEWLAHTGWLRVTDRRVVVLAGRWLGRNRVVEIPRGLVRVRPAVYRDPVIRLEASVPVDDDLLAFRANDLILVPNRSRLRIHEQTRRTGDLRDALLLVLPQASSRLT
jgi:hypothetical protein